MIVDTHVHIWEISDKYPVGPTSPTWSSYPDEPGTAEQLVEDMDAEGVDRTVIVQTSWSTWDNGYMADSVLRFPDRFIGHGLIDPQDPKNVDKARYWVKERGLAGFRLHPMYYPEEKILLNKQNEPLWEEIAELGAVVQFHLRPCDADQVSAIAGRCPDTPLILDHMGYPNLEEPLSSYDTITDLAEFDNIFFKLSDVAGRSSQDFPYTDVHPFIRQALRKFGADRIIWGTGYPGHHRVKNNWPTLAQELRLVREGLPFLSSGEIDRILGGTAAEIWNLSKKRRNNAVT